jgi:hypothetical protein
VDRKGVCRSRVCMIGVCWDSVGSVGNGCKVLEGYGGSWGEQEMGQFIIVHQSLGGGYWRTRQATSVHRLCSSTTKYWLTRDSKM